MAVTIYCLEDPVTFEIRYVGKTIQSLHDRLLSHCTEKRDTHKKRWINKLKRKGKIPLISVLEICNSNKWKKQEKYWIKYCKSIGCNLTNTSDGGDVGLPKGYKHSPEAIEKIRNASKRPNAGKFKKGRISQAKGCKKPEYEKTILQYDLEGNFLMEWKGIRGTAKVLNLNMQTLSDCLNGRCNRAGKFMWRHYEENYPLKIERYIRYKKIDKGERK